MSLGFLTLDILIILIIFFGTLIYAVNAGKKPVVKLLLTVYPALLIFLNLQIGVMSDMTKIGTFLGIYIALYLLLKRNFTAPSTHSGGKKFFDALMLSIASVFTLLTIYYKVLPIETFYELKLPFSGILAQKIPFYITLIVPAFLIMLTNKRDNS